MLLALAARPAAPQDGPILQRLAAFNNAFNAGDASAVTGVYTADAALMPPGRDVLVGRQAIARHYAAAFAAGVGGPRYDVPESRGHGPATAVQIGETTFTEAGRTIRGAPPQVWVLQDGTWRLSRDIYHLVGAE